MPWEFIGKSTNYTKVCVIHRLYTILHKTFLGFADIGSMVLYIYKYWFEMLKQWKFPPLIKARASSMNCTMCNLTCSRHATYLHTIYVKSCEIHILFYYINPWVVIGNDWTGSCKFNYHTTMTMEFMIITVYNLPLHIK